MATEQKTTGLTYQELLRMFPDEDNVRRELIDGELVVSPAPNTRHQLTVAELTGYLYNYSKHHGGKVLPGPYDVYFADRDVLEPDVLFVLEENLPKLDKRHIRSAPDLVIEVSSPSTRRYELVRKFEIYQRYGVPEYWYVDLDADRVEVFVLEGETFGTPTLLTRGRMLTSERLPGLAIPVDDVLGSSPDQISES